MATSTAVWATSSPYIMTLDTSLGLLFVGIIFLTFLIFILYIIYPTKEITDVF